MDREENILGTEKIGKLIKKFSIPCIISLLVNALYNMVDQIFIGWGVGYLGNGATNIVFPLTVIALALSLMFGDGSSAYLSLKLGQNKKDEASKGVANGILGSTIFAILYCIVVLIFLPKLLTIFGCTSELRPYAVSYGYIIAFGLPFTMIGITLNGIIRADGNPKYAMTSMLAGAILNIILDPIMIFVFKLGVQGAAIATVFSQFVTFAMNIYKIKKFNSIKITKSDLRLNLKIITRVALLGISSFITQMSIVVVIATQNNLLAKYGAESEYGSNIPITVLGIVMKVSQIINSIVIGIAVGAQPILGYNYGAKKFDRVKKTLLIVLSASVSVCIVAFILFQTIPDKLISIFGSGDAKYMDFACKSFKIFLLLIIINGIQIPSGIFFQAIGKSLISAVLSLSRQILFLVPAMIILSGMYGVIGVLYSGPVADGLAFLVSGTFLLKEIKELGKNKEVVSQSLIDDTSTNNILSKKVIITIAREYGSGGRYVGRLIADKLGIKLYDKDLVIRLAEKTGLAEEYIESNEQKMKIVDSLNNGYYQALSNSDELFIKETELINEIADKESCVLIGRCSDYILRDREDVLKVFIYGKMNNKIERAQKYYGLDSKKAEKEIKNIDKLRANHYKHYTGKVWGNVENYDICINSDVYGVEKTADLICEIVKSM